MNGLNDLRTLLVLLSERSVTKAAASLGLSQPAASNALARLRRRFADPLLLPSRSGMVVTDRAGEIGREAREIVNRYDALFDPPAAFDPATSRRKFVLTCSQFAEHVLIPGLFKLLRRQAPNVRLDVRSPDADRIYQWLESGQVDLRVAWPYEPAGSLRYMPLVQDRIVCVADRRHPAIGGKLELDTFLLLPQVQHAVGGRPATVGRVVEDAIRSKGVSLAQVMLVQNFLTIPDVVSGSDLIAMLPERVASALARDHELQVLTPPLKLPRIRYAAYWHERSHKDPGHRWLRAMVLEATRAAGRSGPIRR